MAKPKVASSTSRPEESKNPAAATVLQKKAPIPEYKSHSSKVASSAPAQSSVRPVSAVVPVAAAPAPVASAAPAPVAAASTATPAAVSATPAADAASANAAPVKRGIFGFLSNSKKNIASTPTAAPSIAAPLTNSGLFSPSAQSSAKLAPPAMVDSIIKSAKLDSVATSTKVQSPPESDSAKSTGSAGSSSAKIPATATTAPLKDAFASKSLISNIVNNYNNALNATPAVASTPAAAPRPVVAATPVAAAAPILRDITSTANAPAAKIAPAPVPVVTAPVQASVAAVAPVASEEYVIEDRDDSDESGTDGEGEADDKKPKQNVPDWARGPLLKEALERQYGLGGQIPMDPDLIFHEVSTCSLEEIFGVREGLTRKYGNRSSSAHWDADQMTLVEKRVYRKHMGYDRGHAVA